MPFGEVVDGGILRLEWVSLGRVGSRVEGAVVAADVGERRETMESPVVGLPEGENQEVMTEKTARQRECLSPGGDDDVFSSFSISSYLLSGLDTVIVVSILQVCQ